MRVLTINNASALFQNMSLAVVVSSQARVTAAAVAVWGTLLLLRERYRCCCVRDTAVTEGETQQLMSERHCCH